MIGESLRRNNEELYGERKKDYDEMQRKYEELRKEYEELRRELRELREELRESRERPFRTPRSYIISIEKTLGDLMEDLLEGLRSELRRSVIVGPKGVIISGRKIRGEPKPDFDEARAAELLGALANENRLKILKALSRGGKYLSELEEAVQGISPSTLSNHLDQLKEAGLVVQEAVRGRYLITIRGRLVLKTLTRLLQLLEGEEDEASDYY